MNTRKVYTRRRGIIVQVYEYIYILYLDHLYYLDIYVFIFIFVFFVLLACSFLYFIYLSSLLYLRKNYIQPLRPCASLGMHPKREHYSICYQAVKFVEKQILAHDKKRPGKANSNIQNYMY